MATYIDNIIKSNRTNTNLTKVEADLTPEVQRYSQQFLSFAKASTENTIAMCELLNRAKVEFKQKEKNNKNKLFNALCTTIGYTKGASDPTIKKFVRIGENADRFKPYIDRLPNSWTTLYEITQLDSELFDKAIENGAINIKMIGREVKSLKETNQPDTPKSPTAQKPSISITLEAETDKAVVEALYKELELLKFNYQIELTANDAVNRILNDS